MRSLKTWLAAAILVLSSLSIAAASGTYIVQNGSPTPGVVALDVYVADQLGFFRDEGLAVKMHYSQGGGQAMQIAASGDVDLGRVPFEPYLSGYSQGMRGKFYMRTNYHNIFFIAVPNDSEIKDVADLRGKLIGVPNMGSAAIVVVRSMLGLAGLPTDNSVFLPVGTGASALQALKDGRVQALALWDAGYSALERIGAKFRYLQHPKIGRIGNSGFFISDSSLRKRRNDHVGFLRAIAKARLFITEYPEIALKIYWKEVPSARLGKTEEEQVANGLSEINFMNPFPKNIPAEAIGQFNFDQLAVYMDVMRDGGVLKADLKVTDVFSNELLDEIGKIDVPVMLKTALSRIR